LTFADSFYPESLNTKPTVAGLLTYSPPEAFPSPCKQDSGSDFQEVVKEHTAAGTVQDLHLIP
jgi:hypothetical protein